MTADDGGADGDAGIGEIVDGGLYGPGSQAWRLNREAMLLLGAGPRALLLQLAHPHVAAGVAEHSDFRADPWTRLSGTLRSYLRIVYGTTEAAHGEIRRLNALHRGIRGEVVETAQRGRPPRRYSALDPALSMWVHATLVDSTMVAYDRWVAPLSRADRAAYYRETLPVGRAFGIPDRILPSDHDGFEAYLASMLAPDGPVVVGDVARELADVVLHPPLGPAAAAAGPPVAALAPLLEEVPSRAYGWLFWPSIGLLPASVREGYGLPWGVRQRVVAAWLVASWRAWRPVLPTGFRSMPQALRAEHRVAAGRPLLGGPAPTVSTGPGTATAGARTGPSWTKPEGCRA